MENSEGQLEPRGYHTSAKSGLDHVPVSHMTLNRATGNYEFIADGDTTPSIYWNPNKLDLEVPQHTTNEERPYLPPSITVLPLPEEASDNNETKLPHHGGNSLYFIANTGSGFTRRSPRI